MSSITMYGILLLSTVLSLVGADGPCSFCVEVRKHGCVAKFEFVDSRCVEACYHHGCYTEYDRGEIYDLLPACREICLPGITNLSKKQYIEIVRAIICNESKYSYEGDGGSYERFIEGTLSLLYEECNSRPYELAAITATVLHNTSYFSVLEAQWSDDFYRSRGILQITFYSNYEKLSHLTHNRDYIRNPGILAHREVFASKDSIKFWKWLSKCYCEITFEIMMRLLKPEEVVYYKKACDYYENRQLCEEYIKRYNNRLRLYNYLKEELYNCCVY
jgi:hypothetical protein